MLNVLHARVSLAGSRTVITTAIRMTLIARRRRVGIARHVVMIVVHFALIGVFVAINAAEGHEIARRRVALITEIPLVAMIAGIDWEVLSVVIEI